MCLAFIIFMKELSIFVDESGDFGSYDYRDPLYIFSLIFHEQNCDINSLIFSLDNELEQIKTGIKYFHAGPIIRRENEYKDLDIKTRRRIFNKMSYFVNHLPINYLTIITNKKEAEENQFGLFGVLSKLLGRLLLSNISFFQKFDLIKIYYDNGQKQLSLLLATCFGIVCENIEFKKVDPHKYKLFQVADYISTLELTNKKYKSKAASKSEQYFFGNYRDFYRNYYRHILKKNIK